MVDQMQIAYCSEALARHRELPDIHDVIGWVAPDESQALAATREEQRKQAMANQLYSHLRMYQASREAKGDG